MDNEALINLVTTASTAMMTRLQSKQLNRNDLLMFFILKVELQIFRVGEPSLFMSFCSTVQSFHYSVFFFLKI